MHHQGPSPQDPWQSPWSDAGSRPPAKPRGSPASREPRMDMDEDVVIDTTPIIQELNASFARQRHRQNSLLLALSVLVFSLTILAWIYVRDDAPPWDADLAGEKTSTADSSAPCPAPERLRQALEAARPSDAPELAARSPALWDTPALSRLVGANAATFAAMKELSDIDWQPAHPAWKAVDLGGSEQKWQALGVAKEAAVAYYSRRGQDEAAMLGGMELAVLAQKLQSLSAWPTYYARGVEVHERACRAIASMLRQAGMDSRTLSNVQAEFERLTPTDAMLKARLHGFYEFERRLIVGTRPGDPWNEPVSAAMADHGTRLFFKPNQTLALFASSMRELADQTPRAATAVTHQISLRIGPPGIPPGFPGGPNRAGLRYANERIWQYAKLLDCLALQRTRHMLVLTLFGVRRYALDHGRAPEKLEDLLPRYFSALPLDPYTGEPLHYDAKQGLIFSVGTNFKDEGGRANDDPLSDDTEPTVMVR